MCPEGGITNTTGEGHLPSVCAEVFSQYAAIGEGPGATWTGVGLDLVVAVEVTLETLPTLQDLPTYLPSHPSTCISTALYIYQLLHCLILFGISSCIVLNECLSCSKNHRLLLKL